MFEWTIELLCIYDLFHLFLGSGFGSNRCVYPFLDRMEARYHRVPTAKNSRTMSTETSCDEGFEKLALDSQIGPLNTLNSCKLHSLNFHYINKT